MGLAACQTDTIYHKYHAIQNKDGWQKTEQFLQTHEYIMNADVRELCGVSAATANRILSDLAETNKLAKYRKNGHWVYVYKNIK